MGTLVGKYGEAKLLAMVKKKYNVQAAVLAFDTDEDDGGDEESGAVCVSLCVWVCVGGIS